MVLMVSFSVNGIRDGLARIRKVNDAELQMTCQHVIYPKLSPFSTQSSPKVANGLSLVATRSSGQA